MQKLLSILILTLLYIHPVSAKELLCTEQFIGVVITADGSEWASPITREEKAYKNKVVDNGDSFIVTLHKGYQLRSGKLKKTSEGIYQSSHHGLSYMKIKDKFYIGETEHEPRYREWSVYKNCKEIS